MTAVEIVFSVIGVVLLLSMIGLGIVFAYLEFKEIEKQRNPQLKNENLKSKIDKDIKRLDKVYRKTDIEKIKFQNKVKVKEQELDDLFFEIKGLTDLKFKVEDNAKGDYLNHSLNEEMAWCERAKRKHSLRIKNEDKRIDKELISKRGAYEKKQRKET